ncbi:Hypothetical protein PHPALM_1903 [Phytophthora palmivora]|uniref:Retrotransposon gag domain-containing protein n=1 Tax=Phytophthora palmivora TaxID=4796 RepID=A0A2P4YR41_9STRA|nr:Hypothetical protein PHPALM_1903 [Phytophthora palmivora]
MYEDEQDDDFEFIEAWRVLRDEPKWKALPDANGNFRSNRKCNTSAIGEPSIDGVLDKLSDDGSAPKNTSPAVLSDNKIDNKRVYRDHPRSDLVPPTGTQGKPASLEIGSPTTPLNQDRSADRQSFGRSSTDGTEEGRAKDLEEKPLPPPQVPSGTPADPDSSRDLQDESPPAKAIQTLVSKSSTKKKSARSKPLRKKMKAPGSDADDQDDLKTVWTDESLEIAYHKKELHTFLIKNPVMQIIKPKISSDLKGPVRKPAARSSKFEAAKALLHLIKLLLQLSTHVISTNLLSIFDLLKPLVGEKIVTPKITTGSTDDMLGSLPTLTLKDQTGTSSHYESATEEVDTDSAEDPPRMTLGPSGVAILKQRKDQEAKRMKDVIAPTMAQGSNAKLESYFQAAMNRFLKEQQGTSNPVISAPAEDRDVDMESVGSPDQHPNQSQHLPESLDLSLAGCGAVASASATTTGRSTSVPRIRVSAMSELKEFVGKEGDEDRARAWLNKVKSAFVRDQAPDEDKCLVFGDLLTGSARNWYRQLSRTTRSTWKDLLRNFQLRGNITTRARLSTTQEFPETLEHLTHKARSPRLQIKDGPSEVRREHVEHFIETLDDRDLADHLALLRIPDADTLEEALRSPQRAKARQSKAVYGSIKPRQTGINIPR